MKKSNQRGFALFELLLVIAIVAAVALVGVRVIGNHKNTQASSVKSGDVSSQSKESTTAATVPEVTDKADLDKAATSLDQNDNSAEDNNDSGQLNSQADF